MTEIDFILKCILPGWQGLEYIVCILCGGLRILQKEVYSEWH